MEGAGLRHDLNTSVLLTELPLPRRPQAARDAGDAIESWWPVERPVPDDRQVDAFVAAVGDAAWSWPASTPPAATWPPVSAGWRPCPAGSRSVGLEHQLLGPSGASFGWLARP